MTGTLTTAQELYRTGDPTLLAFLKCWLVEGRVALPLADYLYDLGLDKQGDCVKWMVEQPDRLCYKKLSGPYPVHYDSLYKDYGWNIVRPNYVELPNQLPDDLFKHDDNYLVTPVSIELACCLALDAWRG